MKVLILIIGLVVLSTGCNSISQEQVKKSSKDNIEKITDFKASEPVVNRYIEDIL